MSRPPPTEPERNCIANTTVKSATTPTRAAWSAQTFSCRPQAPAEYQDRATLWNAVEKAERGKKAQLAYSFDIALQNEFSLEENIALARQFVSEQFVGRA